MIRRNRLLRAAAASVVCVLASGAWLPAAAQTEGVFSIGIPRAMEAPSVAQAPAREAGPAPAEVQAVWDLGAVDNWDSASNLLASLQASHPGWKPPANLRAYLTSGRLDQRVRDALAAQEWSKALALIPPARPGVCEAPFHLWSRAEALEGLGDPAAVQAFYIRVLTTCSEPDQVASLVDRSLSVLDAAGLAAVRSIPALADASDPKVMVAYTRILRAENRMLFETAAGQGDLQAVRLLAGSSDDSYILTQAGWTILDLDAAASARYFERALELGGDNDARRGFVLATLASGGTSSARSILAQAPNPKDFADLAARTDLVEAAARRGEGDWQGAITLAASARRADQNLATEAERVMGGALLDASGDAFDNGDFETARQRAMQAAEFPTARRAALMRAAWSDLQLGDAGGSASAFSRLYLESPDAESAEGYALAAERTGDLDTAAALARAIGGPLGAKVDARLAAAAFNDGDYLTARTYAPASYEALEGVDRTWYRQAVAARSQGGTSGENRLRGFVSTTSAGTARGPNRFEVGLSVYSLDPGGSTAPGRTASREAFAAPYMAWSREGDTHLAARIGLVPLGGDVDPVLTGDVVLSQDSKGRVIEARAFSRPKNDSVLSFAGQKDASGAAYGRVAETGAQVRGRLPVGKMHSIQADVTTTYLGGEKTADNSMVSAGVSASRAIEADGFAYLVTGPFYQFQSYDRNSNFFTPGHGGYFSPQSFHRAGWSANAQTDPLKDWIAKADFAAAYESVEEDPARENPLMSGPQSLVGGSKSTGVAGALDLAVARRVSSEVIVSGNLSAIASEAYEDFRIGIALTWVPGGRAGLTRTDLPADPFTPGSWVRP